MPFYKPLRVPLKAASSIGVALTLLAAAGVGANWLFTKETPTGESAVRNIICWNSGSGSGVCVRENGAGAFSGSITTGGAITIDGGSPIGSGSLIDQTGGDSRYANVSGDTFTGSVVMANSAGAQRGLWTSAGLLSSSGSITTLNTVSGAHIHASTAFSGAGLINCTGASDAVSWNSATEQFGCTTISSGGGISQEEADARYVNQSGDTMTGALTVTGSSLSVSGSIILNKHIDTDGTIATVTSCGGSPSIIGNDIVGAITCGSGSPVSCTLVFGETYDVAPICLAVGDDGLGVDNNYHTTARSTTSTTFTPSVGDCGGDIIYYHCIQP